MKKTLKKIATGLLLVPAFALVVGTVAPVADTTYAQIGDGADAAKGTDVSDGGVSVAETVRNVINILLFIVGALAVVMLVWGGIRYITSSGNSNSVTAAKNTILYAVIGLLVAFFSYAIVNWVLQIGSEGSVI